MVMIRVGRNICRWYGWVGTYGDDTSGYLTYGDDTGGYVTYGDDTGG